MSVTGPLLVTLAYSVVTDAPWSRVLKIAHRFTMLRSFPKPAAWKFAVSNVATNSSERPGRYVAAVPTSAPSTRKTPLPTVADPPPPHRVVVQPAGSALPEKSESTVGVRITSPSAFCATYVLVRAPAEKSTVAVSCKVGPGTVKLGAIDIATAPALSTDVTRK